MTLPQPLRILAALAALFFVVAYSVESSAAPDILEPSDRPHFFAGGIGVNFYEFYRGRGCSFGRSRYICRRDQFKAVLEYGYHFSGEFEGPAIGVAVDQTFDEALYTFNPAFKFWWDIEIADMAIYITPWAKVGYLLGSDWFDDRDFDDDFIHGFNVGFGVEGRVILNNRALLFLRPVHIDTFFGDFPGDKVFIANWSLLIGGGVVWD